MSRLTKYYNAPMVKPECPDGRSQDAIKTVGLVDMEIANMINDSEHSFAQTGIFGEVGELITTLEAGAIQSEEKLVNNTFEAVANSLLRIVNEDEHANRYHEVFKLMIESNRLGMPGFTIMINVCGNYLLNKLGQDSVYFGYSVGRIMPLDKLLHDDRFITSYLSKSGNTGVVGRVPNAHGYVRCGGINFTQAFMRAFKNATDDISFESLIPLVTSLDPISTSRKFALQDELRFGAYNESHFIYQVLKGLCGDNTD